MSGKFEERNPAYAVHIYPVWIENRQQWAVKRVWTNGGRETVDMAVYEFPGTARIRAEHLQNQHNHYHPDLPPAPIVDKSLPSDSERLETLERELIRAVSEVKNLIEQTRRQDDRIHQIVNTLEGISNNQTLATQNLKTSAEVMQLMSKSLDRLQAAETIPPAAVAAVASAIDYVADAVEQLATHPDLRGISIEIDNARRQLAEAQNLLNPER